MALVRCPDCGKSISDKAVSCNACGCPLGGGSSSSAGNTAFEKRVEQYKANGYNILKRNSNSVEMIKFNLKVFLLTFIPLIIVYLFTMFAFDMLTSFIFLFFCCACLAFVLRIQNKVIISLSTTGKIEEFGNVLKKK